MLPNTPGRVPQHTAAGINEAVQREIDRSVALHARHPERIRHRLAELDREWDVERTLEANAATIALGGVIAAAAFNKRFLIVPAVVTAFLLQHALQGWCPPLPVLRRLGFRTMREIDTERYALKALRGDFGRLADTVEGDERAAYAVEAARS